MLCDRSHCPRLSSSIGGKYVSPLTLRSTVLQQVLLACSGILVACAFLLVYNHLILQGLFDAAYFNAVFGNVYDQRDELLRTALLLKPG